MLYTNLTHSLISFKHQLIFSAPGDYTDASGTLIITEDETVQCVSVSITSDSADEQDRECFAFAISTAMEQISVETVQATICINDDDGIYSSLHLFYKKSSMHFKYYTATQVTVGLQQTSYTVTEDHTLLLVCTTVESGSIAGRTITIDYQTADGDAQGNITVDKCNSRNDIVFPSSK